MVHFTMGCHGWHASGSDFLNFQAQYGLPKLGALVGFFVASEVFFKKQVVVHFDGVWFCLWPEMLVPQSTAGCECVLSFRQFNPFGNGWQEPQKPLPLYEGIEYIRGRLMMERG